MLIVQKIFKLNSVMNSGHLIGNPVALGVEVNVTVEKAVQNVNMCLSA